MAARRYRSRPECHRTPVARDSPRPVTGVTCPNWFSGLRFRKARPWLPSCDAGGRGRGPDRLSRSREVRDQGARAILLGLVALAAAFVAAAATIPSPDRPAPRPGRGRAAAGQEGLDFDSGALAALRSRRGRSRSKTSRSRPALGPRSSSTIRGPRARRPDHGPRPDGETSSRCRDRALLGEDRGRRRIRRSTLAHAGRLVAYVHSTAGMSTSARTSPARLRRPLGDSPLNAPPAAALDLRRRGAAGRR